MPGLINEIALLAWTHRGESSLIHAIFTNPSDADGYEVRVEMIPRSFWDEDPGFMPKSLRQHLLTRQATKVCTVTMTDSEGKSHSEACTCQFDDKHIRGDVIVEALTAATRAEDIADAFAWVGNMTSADQYEQQIRLI